jgi:hypothetical protein
VRINQLCRANKIAFFSADTFGHSGGFFVDLGAEFSFQREMGTGENQQLSAPQTMRFCSLDAALATRWSELTNRFGLVSPVYVCGQRASRARASSPRGATARGGAHTVLRGRPTPPHPRRHAARGWRSRLTRGPPPRDRRHPRLCRCARAIRPRARAHVSSVVITVGVVDEPRPPQ